MNDDFDAWLTAELDRGLSSARPRSRFEFPSRSRRVTLKAATLAFAAVLVTSGVALAAGNAVTGTPNPAVWGQQVRSHVQECQKQLATGQHGIGDCVSAFAKQHGQQEIAAHANGNGVSHGHSQDHAHGASGTHPSGPKESPEPTESPDS